MGIFREILRWCSSSDESTNDFEKYGDAFVEIYKNSTDFHLDKYRSYLGRRLEVDGLQAYFSGADVGLFALLDWMCLFNDIYSKQSLRCSWSGNNVWIFSSIYEFTVKIQKGNSGCFYAEINSFSGSIEEEPYLLFLMQTCPLAEVCVMPTGRVGFWSFDFLR